tara:strand:- start:1457 stop:1624 length:168 start_codon:yes stop_codon:yes gene_type:complete
LVEYQPKLNPALVDVISRLSPVAWQHINLNGEYAFNKDRKEIDLAGLLNDVESII